jgi:aryl-alcohol dehydrogenase
MQIAAAVAINPLAPFLVQTVALDEPRRDEILVKIAGVGLCHADLIALAGKMIPVKLPAVLGHEGSGIVAAVGAGVSKFKVGDRVAMSFRSCGHCINCGANHPAYCESMAVLNHAGMRPDGTTSIRGRATGAADVGAISSNFFGQSSFASHALTYERNLVKVPDAFPLELAGPLGCGVQTGAGSVLNVLRCAPRSSLLIAGGGSVGLSAVLAAMVAGCSKVIVAEPVANRRELARDLGATDVLDPRAANFAAELNKIAPTGVDHFFDSTGIPAVIAGGINALGLRGSAAIVGVPPELDSTVPVALLPLIGLGRTIHGVIEGDSDPEPFIARLMQLYLDGRFPLDKLITKYPLTEINQAVHDHKNGKCVKAVLIP